VSVARTVSHRVGRTGARGLALLAALALIGAFGSVLYELVDVAGNTTHFALVVAGGLVGATVLARFVRVRAAVGLTLVVLLAGLAWYLSALGTEPRIWALVASNVELLTGQSLHQIRASGVWAVAVAPAPVLATWYLALRRRYVAAAVGGGATLSYLVLTGDATVVVTVLGVVGIAGLLGFGDLDKTTGRDAGLEHVAVVLAVMVVLPFAVTVVPGGSAATPLSVGTGGSGTLEASLLEDRREVRISGDVRLSPAVRFTVESEAAEYWKTNSYDRYTGEGWVQTGGSVPLAETSLTFPQGPRHIIDQRFEVESQLSSMPAAWRPVAITGEVPNRTAVTDLGDLTREEPLGPGDTYSVTSAVTTVPDDRLPAATAGYPERVVDRYTQLPASTPDRVAERTAAITANAEGPYETAAAVERWLEANREYSLSVDRPDGNVADAFLFEMEAGYCTYYATTMVTMLRSEGVPARLATGYTTGEQVAEDRYVVRGLNAHAWVEVYSEGHGWIRFDPTPAGPRTNLEADRLSEARENNVSAADTEESAERQADPASNITNLTNATAPEPVANTSVNPEDISQLEDLEDGGGGDGALAVLERVPPREHLALGAVVLVGAVAGLRRSRAWRWLRRSTAVRWQRRVDPETDVERAFERVAIVLERRHRPRRTGETVRSYLDAVDAPESAHRVAAIRERVRYGGEVDPELADEAVRLVDRVRVAERPNRAPRPPDV